ncbi:EF-hand like protein [Zymoseptoria brevis]|uniref:EF-hand like protein n=1 Tax=Zymoseptoria brevis TaxID=1047168 RepID=A0A0F4GID9_9PEZI|nr:EF-hand like protein [Zymoseptoria brevis]
MSSTPNRLSAMGRQSPFQRQNSTRNSASPVSSPTKAASSLSPLKTNNLSANNLSISSLLPEKTSPFVRRPSQMSSSEDRPTSPFARPSSSLSFATSPSRPTSMIVQSDDVFTTRPSSVIHNKALAPAEPLSPRPSHAPLRPSTASFDGARCSSEEPALASPFFSPPSPANLRPTTYRTATSSTAATVRPSVIPTQPKLNPPKLKTMGGVGSGGAYNHVPQPLLHSMRESFEVLDSSNLGTVTSAAISDMLSQLGLDNKPAALRDFFPPNGPGQLNLARYLDILSAPLADLSQPEELRAAFEAFDVDDSGQIDVSILRDALLHTAPQPGEDMTRLSEKEVDGILGEFAGRRAFGSKGLNAAKGKGDVFKYRDFMANVSGGGANAAGSDGLAV